jgi:hypothetical protein
VEAYKALFKTHLEEGVLDRIRSAWQTGMPLGNDYFRQKIEAKLKCKIGQARRMHFRTPTYYIAYLIDISIFINESNNGCPRLPRLPPPLHGTGINTQYTSSQIEANWDRIMSTNSSVAAPNPPHVFIVY